jgi:hypothetical protein
MNNFQQFTPPDIKMPESVQQATENLGNGINNLKTGVTDTLNDFQNQATAGAGASSDFLQSNSIIAKFVFLILVVIAFLFLMNLGVIILGYFFNPSNNPFIIKGMIPGNVANTFIQDPSVGDKSKIIKLSNNERTGMEFTWSVWLQINDIGSGTPKYQFVFNKGDLKPGSDGITTINNGPGLYLSKGSGNGNNAAAITVIMDTATLNQSSNSNPNSISNSLYIDNIPIHNKWVNICIRLENTMLDIYVNGTISGRLVLPSVPKQNYNDINIGQHQGFNGNLSDLRYFNHALSIVEINNIVYWGPNTSPSTNGPNTTASGNYSYLSSLWYSSKF